LKIYKKANKKQNMINSIMQSEDSARSELKTMIDHLDALNEYLSTVKKTNTIIAKNPEKEYKNDKNSSNNNHDEILGLHNCTVFCNNLVVSKNEGKQFNILQIVSDRKKKKSLHFKIILYCIFIFLIIVSIILIAKKNKE
jgi:uncharacterized protein YktB (UPF0637 family)